MAAAVSFNSTQPILDTTKSTQIVRGTITLTSTYPSGGDTLNLSGFPVQSSVPPADVWIDEAPTSSAAPSGYNLYYEFGTTPANGKLRITSAAGTELSAGNYPAALTGAKIIFKAAFLLGQ